MCSKENEALIKMTTEVPLIKMTTEISLIKTKYKKRTIVKNRETEVEHGTECYFYIFAHNVLFISAKDIIL